MFDTLLVGSLHLQIVLILTVGFVFASVLGYASFRMKASPLLGYLVAGYLIGPFSPGYVADLKIAEQLAEIGIILMMFGVGLHLRQRDLISVGKIAIPGAVIQTIVTTFLGTILIYGLGWSLNSGIVVGLCVAVASTVVLVRLLTENNLLGTKQGHIAIGWLVFEDFMIVFALLLLPILAPSVGGEVAPDIGASIFIAIGKFALLLLIMFTIGRALVRVAIAKVVNTESSELLTLTVLAITFLIATGSALVFGTSIALGALIAGMVIGQTEVRQKVAANSLPMKDAFVVIFFLSVGMLFDPMAIVTNLSAFAVVLGLVLVIKPLIAFLAIRAFKYPTEMAVTVAIALAQIGEFSFILAEEAMNLKILPDHAYDIIVASAFISISINPILFKLFCKPGPAEMVELKKPS